MTEPYMNLNFIRETMDQIFFEEYEVASFARYDRSAISLFAQIEFFLSSSSSSSGNIERISIRM